MNATEEFLAAVLPAVDAADTAIHNGDAGPRKSLWSRAEPVTLFGAAMTGVGWAEIEPIFDRLAESFSDCSSFRNEVVAAGAGGDLAYTVAYEHTTCAIDGGGDQSYALRVTTVFRREDGEWKIVHRHGDPIASDAAAEMLSALTAPGSP